MGRVTKKKWIITDEQYAQLLKKIISVLEEHHICYWLEFGSLLGCVRASCRIPWDHDLDIAVSGVDFERVLEIQSSFCSQGCHTMLKQEPGCYQRLLVIDDDVPSFHCDLYEFKRVEENYVYRWVIRRSLPCRISDFLLKMFCSLKFDADVFRYDEKEVGSAFFSFVRFVFWRVNQFFGSTRELLFPVCCVTRVWYHGVLVSIPVDAEDHLLLNYGHGWRTPDPYHPQYAGGDEFVYDKVDGVERCMLR